MGDNNKLIIKDNKDLTTCDPSLCLEMTGKYKDEQTKIILYKARSNKLWAIFKVGSKEHRFPLENEYWETALQEAKEKQRQAKQRHTSAIKKIQLEFVVEKFLEYKRKNKENQTYHEYKEALRNLILGVGDIEINELDSKMLSAYCNWRQKNNVLGNEINSSTIIPLAGILEWELKFIGNFLGWAAKEKYFRRKIPHISFAEAEHSARILMDDEPKVVKRKRIITDDEWQRIQEVFTEMNLSNHLKILRFIALTGLRYPSEIMKLKWTDYDEKNGNLKITGSKSRNISLSDEAEDILEHFEDRSEHIFIDEKGYRQWNLEFFWDMACRKLDIVAVDVYSLRYYFCARMLKLGFSIPWLVNAMGHTTSLQVTKIYARVMLNALFESMGEDSQRIDLLTF